MNQEIVYDYARTTSDLEQILELQRINLPTAISQEEKDTEGFVTVHHTMEMLSQLNAKYPHTIARSGSAVVGYCLTMLRDFGSSIEVLQPMFLQLDAIEYKGSLIKNSNYLVMGQVCIDKAYRGQGFFAGMYTEMCRRFEPHFQYIITEIALDNKRSLKAHYNFGFENIHEFQSADGQYWVIVLIDLKKHTMNSTKQEAAKWVEMVDYDSQYAAFFKSVNEQWISNNFTMEEADRRALDHPQSYIIDKGGSIIIVLYKGEPIGACALIKMDHAEYDYELAKMGVSPDARGKGIGNLLAEAVINKAKALGAKKIYLESNTKLPAAINLYRKLGFKEVKGISTPYSRCNIQMELSL